MLCDKTLVIHSIHTCSLFFFAHKSKNVLSPTLSRGTTKQKKHKHDNENDNATNKNIFALSVFRIESILRLTVDGSDGGLVLSFKYRLLACHFLHECFKHTPREIHVELCGSASIEAEEKKR